jgi:hypothetical protein
VPHSPVLRVRFLFMLGARDRREGARHNKRSCGALGLFALVCFCCHSEEHRDEESAFFILLLL